MLALMATTILGVMRESSPSTDRGRLTAAPSASLKQEEVMTWS
jgi:hypothetical protein